MTTSYAHWPVPSTFGQQVEGRVVTWCGCHGSCLVDGLELSAGASGATHPPIHSGKKPCEEDNLVGGVKEVEDVGER